MRKLIAIIALAGPALAEDRVTPQADDPLLIEAAWDWRPGDLVFRNGINAADDAIRQGLGLQWASVGVLRPSSGGPRGVFVEQTGGVTESMLYEYVEGLSPAEYAVYRPRALDADYDADAQMWVDPISHFALFIAYGAAFDEQLILGNGSFYNAELPYQGALNGGIVLGAPVALHRLTEGPDSMDASLRALLENHQYCRYELSFEDCWQHNLKDHAIVTTGIIIASGAVDQVFP